MYLLMQLLLYNEWKSHIKAENAGIWVRGWAVWMLGLLNEEFRTGPERKVASFRSR